jgi:hypothetical protein
MCLKNSSFPGNDGCCLLLLPWGERVCFKAGGVCGQVVVAGNENENGMKIRFKIYTAQSKVLLQMLSISGLKKVIR